MTCNMLHKTFYMPYEIWICNIWHITCNLGHEKYDNIRRGHKISNYVHCRFNFPQFPMNKTRFILGMSKQLDLEEIRSRKQDLQKIRKYFHSKLMISCERKWFPVKWNEFLCKEMISWIDDQSIWQGLRLADKENNNHFL